MIEEINYILAMVIYLGSIVFVVKGGKKGVLLGIYWILAAIFLVVSQLLVRSMK